MAGFKIQNCSCHPDGAEVHKYGFILIYDCGGEYFVYMLQIYYECQCNTIPLRFKMQTSDNFNLNCSIPPSISLLKRVRVGTSRTLCLPSAQFLTLRHWRGYIFQKCSDIIKSFRFLSFQVPY